MRKLFLVLVVMFASVSMSLDGCFDSDIAQDIKNNPAKYKELGFDISDIVKDSDINVDEGFTLESAQKGVNTLRDVAITASVVPGAQVITAPLVAGLTAVAAIMRYFAVKKNKQIQVITEDRDKHVAIADDYGDALEAGLMSGENEDVADIGVMARVMDTATKQHFNAKGARSL